MLDLKPSPQEVSDAIERMKATEGWKIHEAWLKDQLENTRLELEISLNPQLQGKVAAYREIFKKLNEYAIKARKTQK